MLVLLLVLLAIAGAGYVLLARANEQAAQSASEDNSIVLSSFSADSLETIQYTYNGEAVSLQKQDGSWILADDPAYHISQTLVNSMATALCQLSATQVIENVTDYSQYGVDAPDMVVTAQVDGETMTFSFGGQNTVSSVGYLQMAGDSNVYAVASSLESTFQYGKADLYDTAWLPVTLLRSDLARIDYHYRNNGEEDTVSLQAESEPTESTSSAASGADDSAAGTTYTQVWYVAGNGDEVIPLMANNMLDAVFTAPTAQITAPGAPAQYGLDAPALTVQLTDTAGSTQTISLGIGADGYYLMKAGDDSVYTVSGDLLTAFAHSAEALKQPKAGDSLDAGSALDTTLDAAG
jgi:hypothetical protein